MTYEEKLLSPKWKEKRSKILERNSFSCQECHNKRIVEISRTGTVKNLVLKDNYLAAMGNKSDSRFRWDKPQYEIIFHTKSGTNISTNIYLEGWEKEKEKKS
jgi:hypothetical protein